MQPLLRGPRLSLAAGLASALATASTRRPVQRLPVAHRATSRPTFVLDAAIADRSLSGRCAAEQRAVARGVLYLYDTRVDVYLYCIHQRRFGFVRKTRVFFNQRLVFSIFAIWPIGVQLLEDAYQ